MPKLKFKQPEVVVSCFILNKQKELFLARGTKWKNKYVIPGGHLNYGETLETCCRREVKEETNLDLYGLKFFTYLDGIKPKDFLRKNIHLVYLYFIAKAKSQKIILDEHEIKDYIWIKPKDILKMKSVHSTMKPLIHKFIQEKYVR